MRLNSMSKAYYISSANRVADTSSSFVLYLNPPIMEKKRARLQWFSLANTLYNVRTGVNNTLAFTDGTAGVFAFQPEQWDIVYRKQVCSYAA